MSQADKSATKKNKKDIFCAATLIKNISDNIRQESAETKVFHANAMEAINSGLRNLTTLNSLSQNSGCVSEAMQLIMPAVNHALLCSNTLQIPASTSTMVQSFFYHMMKTHVCTPTGLDFSEMEIAEEWQFYQTYNQLDKGNITTKYQFYVYMIQEILSKDNESIDFTDEDVAKNLEDKDTKQLKKLMQDCSKHLHLLKRKEISDTVVGEIKKAEKPISTRIQDVKPPQHNDSEVEDIPNGFFEFMTSDQALVFFNITKEDAMSCAKAAFSQLLTNYRNTNKEFPLSNYFDEFEISKNSRKRRRIE